MLLDASTDGLLPRDALLGTLGQQHKGLAHANQLESMLVLVGIGERLHPCETQVEDGLAHKVVALLLGHNQAIAIGEASAYV